MLTDEETSRLENLRKNIDEYNIVMICRDEKCEFCREAKKIAEEKGIELIYEDQVMSRNYVVGIPEYTYIRDREKILGYVEVSKRLDDRLHMDILRVKHEGRDACIAKYGESFEAFLGISQEEDDIMKIDERKNIWLANFIEMFPGTKLVDKFETKWDSKRRNKCGRQKYGRQ